MDEAVVVVGDIDVLLVEVAAIRVPLILRLIELTCAGSTVDGVVYIALSRVLY